MKKTLIAFAALSAIAGVAQAQSSVTLYGLVDAFVGQTSKEVNSTSAATPASAKLKQNVVNSSGQNNSRWGLKGTEDLGGGLKAVFQLEGGFDTDTGGSSTTSNQGGSLFGRQSWVGLSSSTMGTVGLGRQYPAYDDLRGATNMIYDSNFATTGTVWGAGVKDYQNRSSNAIKYISPDFAGFSGAVSYGFGENKQPATATAAERDAENVTAIHIKYANGPLLVGYAHQREKQVAGGNYFGSRGALGSGVVSPAVTVSDTRKYNLLGASYDFGVAKVTGQYNQATGLNAANIGAKDKEFNVGVVVPFGAAAVAAGYSRSKSDAAGDNNKGTGVSLLGTYALSKRTNLYTGFLVTKVESNNAATETKASTFGLGVKHVF